MKIENVVIMSEVSAVVSQTLQRSCILMCTNILVVQCGLFLWYMAKQFQVLPHGVTTTEWRVAYPYRGNLLSNRMEANPESRLFESYRYMSYG